MFLFGQSDSRSKQANFSRRHRILPQAHRFFWQPWGVRLREDLLAIDKVIRLSASTLFSARLQNKSRATALTESRWNLPVTRQPLSPWADKSRWQEECGPYRILNKSACWLEVFSDGTLETILQPSYWLAFVQDFCTLCFFQPASCKRCVCVCGLHNTPGTH